MGVEDGKSVGEEYANWNAESPKAESPKEEDVWADEVPNDDLETMPKPSKPEYVGKRYGESYEGAEWRRKIFAREIAVHLMDSFISDQHDLTPRERNELSIFRDHMAEAHSDDPTMHLSKAIEEATQYMKRMDPVGTKKFQQEYRDEIYKARGR